jgi:hypothetical protein
MAVGGIRCFDLLGAHRAWHIKDYLQNLDAHRPCAGLGQHKDCPWDSLLSCFYSNGAFDEDIPQRPDAPEDGQQSCELSLRQYKTTKRTDGKDILMIDLLIDLWGFMKVRKKFWLAPIIIILLLLGALIVFSQGSAVAPFIYTLF